jgi:hypothetical protein
MSNRVSVGLPKVTPRGQQGNWLIAVNIPGYGELQLPCAHNRFIKGVELQYSREEDVEEMVKGYPTKYRKWREALLTHQMVVVTDDDYLPDKAVRRRGYLGVYKVTDIRISPDEFTHAFPGQG